MIFDFAQPLFLILLVIVPFLLWLQLSGKRDKRQSFIEFSNIQFLKNMKTSWRYVLHRVLFYVKIIAIVLFIIALAGPRSGTTHKEVETDGVDIVIALDISSSMGSLDFEPKNRLEVAKNVVSQFVKEREADRLGLVIFSSGAFTQCPLTLDHDLLQTLLKRVEIGLIEDGTAIGNAIAVSTSRLIESEAKSKVIILLTDGVNNRGEITPLDAAKLAADNKIKIYAIGAGRKGTAPMIINDPVFGKRRVDIEVKIDEETLKEIADITKGEYFRAENAKGLKKIYDKISKMETTKMKPKYYTNYTPLFYPFLLSAVLLILVCSLLEFYIIKKTP